MQRTHSDKICIIRYTSVHSKKLKEIVFRMRCGHINISGSVSIYTSIYLVTEERRVVPLLIQIKAMFESSFRI